jgi:phosphate starvation-inducible protein PhoH and related proteins
MPLPKDNMLFGFANKLTDEQRIYVDSIFDNQLTIVNAKSGTGKTTLAVACAKLIGRPLVYVFAPVQEKAMGYRPGKQAEKENEYYQPLVDALLKINENPSKVMYSEDNPDALKAGHVWVYPKSHIFARGTNMEEYTVIIDECQNFTRGELKKLLTRIHDSCNVIMIGHDGQCDLPDPKKSGFVPYINHFADEPYCKTVELTKNFRGKLAQKADDLTW